MQGGAPRLVDAPPYALRPPPPAARVDVKSPLAAWPSADTYPLRGGGGGSVPIPVRLVGAFHGHADVLRLLGAELGELRPQLVQMQPRHLLVQVLGQGVDLPLVLRALRGQLDLRDDLVREAPGHPEAGM